MRGGDEEDQPHVGDRGLGVNEGLETKAENDRRPPSDAFAPQPPAPGKKQDRGQAPPQSAEGNRAAKSFSPKSR